VLAGVATVEVPVAETEIVKEEIAEPAAPLKKKKAKGS
jgi:hypothetical protein